MELHSAQTESRNMRDLLFSLKLAGLFIVSLMVVCHTLVAPSSQLINIPPTKACRDTETNLGWEIGLAIFVFSSTEALYLLALGVVTLLAVTTIIYDSMQHHSGEESEYSSWKKISGTWKKLMVTWVYVILLAAAYVLSVVIFIGYSATVFKDILLRIVVSVVVLVSCLYLMVVWILESVIEVFEEDMRESDIEHIIDDRLLTFYLLEEGVPNQLEMKNNDGDGDHELADELLGHKSMDIMKLKILLVFAACAAAAYVLVQYGVDGSNTEAHGMMVMSIVTTFLFLPTELLIFIVFVALFWGLHRVQEGKWNRKAGLCMVWLPLALLLSLLAVDQKQVFAYLNLR